MDSLINGTKYLEPVFPILLERVLYWGIGSLVPSMLYTHSSKGGKRPIDLLSGNAHVKQSWQTCHTYLKGTIMELVSWWFINSYLVELILYSTCLVLET